MKGLVQFINENLICEAVGYFFDNSAMELNKTLEKVQNTYNNASVKELVDTMIFKLGASSYESPMDDCAKWLTEYNQNIPIQIYRIRLGKEQYNIVFNLDKKQISFAKRINISYSMNNKDKIEMIDQNNDVKIIYTDNKDQLLDKFYLTSEKVVWFDDNDKFVTSKCKELSKEINDYYLSVNKHIKVYENVPAKEFYNGLTGSNKPNIKDIESNWWHISLGKYNGTWDGFNKKDDNTDIKDVDLIKKNNLISLIKDQWDKTMTILQQKRGEHYYYMFAFSNGSNVYHEWANLPELNKVIKKYKTEDI